MQRNWQTGVLPWLARHGWEDGFRRFLEVCSSPFNPWIDWHVTDLDWAAKFPINSTEINFIAAFVSVLLYFAVSLATCRQPFNLERMLHRGIYAGADEKKDIHTKLTWKTLLNHFVSITPEYTKGDKIITWVVFFYSIVYQFLLAFVGVVLASRIFHWDVAEWSSYFFIVTILVPGIAGICTTVWFTWGSIKDILRLFRDLEARSRDVLDNGMVEGHVSLADQADFAAKEGKATPAGQAAK